jgi:hypothetical protein
MRRAAIGAAAAGAAAALALLPAAPADAAGSRFFFTPGPNGASCEIDVGTPGLAPSVWCVIEPPQLAARKAVAVRLALTGVVTTCSGLRCVGNAPEHTKTLAYGRSIRVGAFRCTSLKAGVRCLVAQVGRGFQLSRSGVTRLG